MAIKALNSASSAFEAYSTSTSIMGRAKFELEVLLLDMLRELELVPDIKAQLRGGLKFRKGDEQLFAKALAALAQHLEHMDKSAKDAALQDKLSRIEQAFDKAREALREKNLPTARRVLNTVCERYPDEKGIFTRAAKMLAEAGLQSDVIPFAEKAMEIDLKDAQAYGLAVEACRQIGELPKAETILREALKAFGAHPKTYVSLAKVLYQMGRWDQAYDAARSAQDRDPNLAEAREIVELTEKRVMG
ncbi:hypothetical protein NNJEOMEG_01297 [Fundidesulfovibrio magnetotacticus]|uniref:Tetratricopeptide repeat protein n=1 Tax=Fundidesulfovibrio magnetotacticus TaxID=2730080 RepID=A0A6V8LP23_9BACT|nr:tetratricopeptide repeat protein [Fundidesulfovibrio magnetotacticus]GFK93464.1 hypothetical protein NNJEOMEG_01297 [Fundidesulfovibrio magnetotacticus]